MLCDSSKVNVSFIEKLHHAMYLPRYFRMRHRRMFQLRQYESNNFSPRALLRDEFRVFNHLKYLPTYDKFKIFKFYQFKKKKLFGFFDFDV